MTAAGEDVAGVNDAGVEPSPPTGRGLRVVLIAIIAIAVVVIAGAAGWLIRGNNGSSSPAAPQPSAVDIGFARDMAAHHTQAVTMAGYERDNTTNASLKLLAFDIETSQEQQVGQMTGWLAAWGVPQESTAPQMAWMGHHLAPGQLMPGMATAAQLDRLESLHGRAMDILFLQLMINHHLGGAGMAQYAVDNAALPYVRDLAQSIIDDQSAQVIEMERLLRQLGGSPLPPPIQ